MTTRLPGLTASIALASLFGLVALPDIAQAAGPTTDKPILANGKIVVKQSDMDKLIDLNVPPAQRDQVWSDARRLRNLASQLFAYRKLAEEASVYKLTPDERWRLDDARAKALADIAIERAVAAAPQPDFIKASRETYTAHSERFKEPEKLHVEHILVSTKSRDEKEALKRAEEALSKAKVKDANFGALAKEYSDDPSAAKNAGDLGWFSKGRMVKAFEDAAFALKTPGEIAGPVKTDFGYHIIRFIERKPEGTRSFDEVKDQLVNEEKMKLRRERINAVYQRVNNLPDTVGDQEALEELVRPLGGATKPNSSAQPARSTATPVKK